MSTRDPRTWMWAEACELLDQAERLHRQFFRLSGHAETQPRWEPPVDVLESGGDVRVAVALPGVDPERIVVQIDATGLLIGAQRIAPVDAHTTAIRRLEIPYGRFERRVPLPAGRYELKEKVWVNGCLELRLVKR